MKSAGASGSLASCCDKRPAFSSAACWRLRRPPRTTFGQRHVDRRAGIKVGHFTYTERPTGCTAIGRRDAVGGVSQHGGAPAHARNRSPQPAEHGGQGERDLAVGRQRVRTRRRDWGDEVARGTRHRLGRTVAKVPIVPAAIIYDLGVGDKPAIRPDATCGYKAAQAATTSPVTEGNVGAGAGAAVGQMGGAGRAMKSGLGSAAITLPNGLVVAALIVVNASGDIIDPATGRVVAGARNADGTLLDLRKMLRAGGTPAEPTRTIQASTPRSASSRPTRG